MPTTLWPSLTISDRALGHAERAERRDEGRNAENGNQPAVDGAEGRADQQAGT
ncbi:hypothetical protein BRDID11002_76610 [Bradyrhizobium diazoefficiens]